ncbi:molybdate ABC transporter substrate-binding protein [Pseudooceanicola sp. 216_PA32_1]|uniref:Molybdate ABC transporter substrate-binding protein n=1 Tax=Pseudooceanicola pacificus TaxID=2676438 RepID=A0A844WAN2_9RHOB|nr:molybdate ABC transporter substrate-binding protein [Pseudooceanicola pacificus]MWB76782.1 molybdate ABC transporter substrate-binding protein [Pseudooceanicola pacificus]
MFHSVFPSARGISGWIVAGLLTLAGPVQAADLTIFAAASLRTALDSVVEEWESTTGLDAAVSYAGSSALARQIAEGAPADIFISANVGWMDHVAALGLVKQGTRVDILSSSLVLIAPGAEGTPIPITQGLNLAGMLDGGKLAMALVDAVPAGIYGKAALTGLGLWDSVAEQVAQADNARAALALVATGEAPLGVVYATDANAEPRVHVVGTFPAESYPPIIYPAAIIADGNVATATEFMTMLRGDIADEIFAAEGFTVLE